MSRPPSLASYLASAAVAVGWLAATLVVFLLPAIMAGLGHPSPWWIVVSAVGLVVLAAAYALRRVDGAYDLTDIGATERVDVRTFRDELHACARCESSTRRGIERRYRRQWVLGGVPLYTMAWGTNAYCPECVDPDTLEPLGEPPAAGLEVESKPERSRRE
ncbi:hypothetical protein [Halorubrum sp. F4]|uniref:hypothetical protein n=1 Tax=Halorubrum sp. F4 TaxID=2989715 RepID=UPI002481820D|nr:hypothetical protein [Halorubrum sp. F4]